MKPSWNDAPDWANWLAMQPTGDWYWYMTEPFVESVSQYFQANEFPMGCFAKSELEDHEIETDEDGMPVYKVELSGFSQTKERRP